MKGELIFGVNPVKESLQGTRGAFNLYVQISATDHRVEKIIKLAEGRGVAVHRKEKQDLTRMCASSHHQGIALEVEPFRYADLDDLLSSVSQSGAAGFLLVLDGIQDPHNLGALSRRRWRHHTAGPCLRHHRSCREVLCRCRRDDPGGAGHQHSSDPGGLEETGLLDLRPGR
jgi:hypothetical protein